jgi:dipeptidyl aminopeptidase/acylaminoacyl peptidase
MNLRLPVVLACLLLAALLPAVAPAAEGVDVDAFARTHRFADLALSPDGKYVAAAIPTEDRTGVRVVRRTDGVVTTSFDVGKDRHVVGLRWASNERLLFRIAGRVGSLTEGADSGELFGIDADGGRAGVLVGLRGSRPKTGTNISAKRTELIIDTDLIQARPVDDRHVLVSVQPWGDFTRVESLDIVTGSRTPVARVPVPRARFVTDAAGVVRFAVGQGDDNISKLLYRAGDTAEWVMVNDEGASGIIETPLGFARDGSVAYLRREHAEGPDSIVAFDPATHARTEVLRDAEADPIEVLYVPGAPSVPFGVRFLDGAARNVYFDPASDEARLQRGLDAAFPGHAVRIASSTDDGRLLLLSVTSPRNPGDFYVYDRNTKKADHVLSRRDWFDPEAMAEVRPLRLPARDGLALHGYLTLPRGSDGRGLPTVVIPHDGPIGAFDKPEFHEEAQLLALAGYAVLQVNYRGSGGYGRKFEQAGAREWGGRMQDDVTDATRWLIAQGIADEKRVCIYGARYGAYAAMMGAVREPGLYRCAAGLAGIYDLPLFASRSAAWGPSWETWTREWVGEGDALEAISPTTQAARVGVPVLLAAGGSDFFVRIDHSKKMEAALRKADVPVETFYVLQAGHGFYYEKHRRDYFETLLAFFARHLGGATAAPKAAAKKSP